MERPEVIEGDCLGLDRGREGDTTGKGRKGRGRRTYGDAWKEFDEGMGEGLEN